ncbi:MAG: 3-isopropylmalate dehydratase small subunit [Oceanicaulis sp.]
MLSEPITRIKSRTFVLREANIDTDQIIPARFLTTTGRESLAEACFADWRYTEAGDPANHPLNTLDTGHSAILVAGDNFGCGSSREHAPWALKDFGFKAVVTSRAADIFKSNALKNGLVICEIDEAAHAALMDRPGAEMEIDVEAETIRAGDIEARFTLEPFARTCLLKGVDPLGYILSKGAEIAAYEARA